MPDKDPEPLVGSRKAYLMAGVITVIPLLITWWVVRFIVTLLRDFGGPAVSWLHLALRPWSPEVARLLLHPWFESVLAVILAVVGFYLLGWGATRVVGRWLLATLDALVHRIPLVSTVYGAVQKFLAVLQQKPDGVDRVVLIDFPSPEMKTVGFVTRTLVDAATGTAAGRSLCAHHPQPHLRLPGDRAVGKGHLHRLDHGRGHDLHHVRRRRGPARLAVFQGGGDAPAHGKSGKIFYG